MALREEVSLREESLRTLTGQRPLHVDARALERELGARIQGEVRFDNGSRALWATDASNYRQVPIGVVLPKSTEDVANAVELARKYGAPVLVRGGGTSLAGQCCNVALVIDASKYMNRVLELDPAKKTARVEPGCILDTLRQQAEQHRLTFGPDPATHNHCTLGGMIGNDSCGIHSMMAGRTAENVIALDVLTYRGEHIRLGPAGQEDADTIVRAGGAKGEIYGRLRDFTNRYAPLIREKFPNIPRRVSGYNLPALLPENGFNVAQAVVGSECTCVVITEALVRLVDSPPTRTLLVLGYPDIYQACDHVPEILESKPIGLEGIDNELVSFMETKHLHAENVKVFPKGRGWLLVEFGGANKDESDDKARKLMDRLKKQANPPEMKLFDNPKEEETVWKVRESGLGATAFVPAQPLAWPGWEDSAVAPDKLGGYLREFCTLLEQYGYKASLYGHFGQGCLHCRISFDLLTKAGVETYHRFATDAARLVVKYGGSLSGEHGDGQSRGELLPIMFGEEMMGAFREFKSIWDPDWKMNPGKLIDARPLTADLRLGTQYNPPDVKTHFAFPSDYGDFARSTLRCVGVGECRKLGGGTMCPSYMVTMEEKDTTRGRAHLLFEMMKGDVIKDGWRSDEVKESLDLCLACKGCKHECPVNVDMATYKAEFLSHYYAGRLRPRSAYSMGFIYWWSRIASKFPELVNFVNHAPLLSSAVKFVGGIEQKRDIPRYAPVTFKQWFRRRRERNTGGPDVILWPDTFNNYFMPRTAAAAVEVLEDAGWHVIVPRQSLCCGRPLYDFGFLETARGLLQQILSTLKPFIEQGTPMVGLEPSCTAVFRDELMEMMPHNEDAARLSAQTFTLAEFLQTKAAGYQPPKIKRKAVVHGHCHHKAIMRFDNEEIMMGKMGLDFDFLKSGCCGMAGSFGFEPGDKYKVSMAAGERVLLPAVREASKETLIIADGFSCREQIKQGSGRQALHIAEVLQMAIREGEQGAPGPYPERNYVRLDGARRPKWRVAAAAASLAAVVVGGVFALRRLR